MAGLIGIRYSLCSPSFISFAV
uniref:Uncharacterized protein n=1 Tax=Vitis vinifera TaxID=29760 RepID=F6HR03_VITVI